MTYDNNSNSNHNDINNQRYEKRSEQHDRNRIIHITAILGGNYRKVQDHLNKDLYIEYDVKCTITTDKCYHEWIVWRRYSEFKKLHRFVCDDMKAVKTISFPKPYNFSNHHFNDDFIKKRLKDLMIYWNHLIAKI